MQSPADFITQCIRNDDDDTLSCRRYVPLKETILRRYIYSHSGAYELPVPVHTKPIQIFIGIYLLHKPAELIISVAVFHPVHMVMEISVACIYPASLRCIPFHDIFRTAHLGVSAVLYYLPGIFQQYVFVLHAPSEMALPSHPAKLRYTHAVHQCSGIFPLEPACYPCRYIPVYPCKGTAVRHISYIYLSELLLSVYDSVYIL